MRKIYLILAASFCLVNGMKAQYSVLHNFNGTNGSTPDFNSLIISGKVLYGMTYMGGASNFGCIFSIDSNGNGFKDLMDFNLTNGAYPLGDLTLCGGRLFGMASYGAANDSGCVFSIDTNGSGYKDLIDFTGPNGGNPEGSLIISGSTMYGMTLMGGKNHMGVIFSLDTSGSNYTKLFDFNDTTDGGYPQGTLILSGNVLYGMTAEGGMPFGAQGNVFSIHTDGSAYTNLWYFSFTDGASPSGALTLIGKTLFGLTPDGGTFFGKGNIFSIDTNGNNFKDFFNFDDTNGSFPFGSLTWNGKKLFGTSVMGGPHYWYGHIFSVDTDGSNYADEHAFDSTHGANPYGTLLLADSSFYGMTYEGGTTNNGVIFRFKSLPKYNCINNYNEQICIVTVDTATNKCEVIWGRTNSPPATGGYNVYRDSASTFVLIHNQPLNALSEYLDTTSNPNAGPVSYKLATIDSCGESALSSSQSTISLTVSFLANVNILNWTPYVGFTPSKYRIFRGLTMGTLVQIDSVPNSVLTYHDTLPPVGVIYMLEAVNPAGVCIPTTTIKHHGIATSMLSGSFSNGYDKASAIQSIGNSLSNVKIFPNPVNGQFTLQSSVISGEWTVGIYNEIGQQVFTKSGNGILNEKINTESFVSGIYSVMVHSVNGIVVKKLVIMQK